MVSSELFVLFWERKLFNRKSTFFLLFVRPNLSRAAYVQFMGFKISFLVHPVLSNNLMSSVIEFPWSVNVIFKNSIAIARNECLNKQMRLKRFKRKNTNICNKVDRNGALKKCKLG